MTIELQVAREKPALNRIKVMAFFQRQNYVSYVTFYSITFTVLKMDVTSDFIADLQLLFYTKSGLVYSLENNFLITLKNITITIPSISGSRISKELYFCLYSLLQEFNFPLSFSNVSVFEGIPSKFLSFYEITQSNFLLASQLLIIY